MQYAESKNILQMTWITTRTNLWRTSSGFSRFLICVDPVPSQGNRACGCHSGTKQCHTQAMRLVCFEMTHRAGRQGVVGCSRSEFSRVLMIMIRFKLEPTAADYDGRVHHMCTFIWYEHNSGIGGSEDERRQHRTRDNN